MQLLAECEVQVARPSLSGVRVRVGVRQAVTIVAAVSSVVFLYVQFGDWTERAEAIAFYAGAGGLGLMFFRWRWHRDRLAMVLSLAGFGTWMVAVIVWPAAGISMHHPRGAAVDLAAAALLIGFAGAIVTLARMYSTPPL